MFLWDCCSKHSNSSSFVPLQLQDCFLSFWFLHVKVYHLPSLPTPSQCKSHNTYVKILPVSTNTSTQLACWRCLAYLLSTHISPHFPIINHSSTSSYFHFINFNSPFSILKPYQSFPFLPSLFLHESPCDTGSLHALVQLHGLPSCHFFNQFPHCEVKATYMCG